MILICALQDQHNVGKSLNEVVYDRVEYRLNRRLTTLLEDLNVAKDSTRYVAFRLDSFDIAFD